MEQSDSGKSRMRIVKKYTANRVPCPYKNSDGTACHRLRFKKGVCKFHLSKLSLEFRPVNLLCDFCHEEITVRTENKNICPKCLIQYGVACSVCGKGTLDFEKSLCKIHSDIRKCTVEGCDKPSLDVHGKRYCIGHYPFKCNEIVTKPCNRQVKQGFDFCALHGGMRVRKPHLADRVKRCIAPFESICNRRLNLTSEVDDIHFMNPEKCFQHGGGKQCQIENCENVACFGLQLLCKEHGGKLCSICNKEPVYTRRGTCDTCCIELYKKNRKDKNI